MHKFIVCCFLIAAAFAAPTGRSSTGLPDTDTPKTAGEKFVGLLKELGVYLLGCAKEFGIGKLKTIAPALITLISERDWEPFVLEFFEGNARELMRNFLDLVQKKDGKTNEDIRNFFKGNTTDIIAEVLKVLGGQGEDLISILTSVMEAVTTRLLTELVEQITEKEAASLARLLTGLVKAIETIATRKSESFNTEVTIDFLADDGVNVGKTFLKRLLTKPQPATNGKNDSIRT
ncbi:hypothetical protein SprV_0401644900 [Sparganum proliferum]